MTQSPAGGNRCRREGRNQAVSPWGGTGLSDLWKRG